MLTKCQVRMKHCYGITEMNHEFEFTRIEKKKRVNTIVAIYAPNGLMKTSMADSFKDYSNGKLPQDRVRPENQTVFEACDQNGDKILSESVFVIESIDINFNSDKISSLLVSKGLKKNYDKVYKNVQDKKKIFLSEMKKKMGITKNLEKTLKDALRRPNDDLIQGLFSVKREVEDNSYKHLSAASYKIIFNDKVVKFLSEDRDINDIISQYSDAYEALLDKSKFFKRGVFSHTDANSVAKSLISNGWFKGGHKVRFRASDDSPTSEISNEEELTNCIKEEKDRILNDRVLSEIFDRADAKFSNKELHEFRKHIGEHPEVVPELKDMNDLKLRICIAYLSSLKIEYMDLLNTFDEGKKEINSIVAQADAELTHWEGVIDEFNDRFSVPFKISVKNKTDAVLGINGPQVEFTFKDRDGEGEKKISEEKLKEVLSNGEQRARYIMNILFEIKARENSEQETLIIVDDIADSFDYKNKYAIVEYLREISEKPNFRMIVMSHNFDFYRTITKRLDVYGEHKLIAEKSDKKINLVQDTIDANHFSQWIKNLHDPKCMIGCIPFMRNLAQYTANKDPISDLTGLLHIKNDSKDSKDFEKVTFGSLAKTFREVLPTLDIDSCYNEDQSVISTIAQICDEICLHEEGTLDLLDKVVLSIGIRLEAERFLLSKVEDRRGLDRDQTGRLIGKFCDLYKDRGGKYDYHVKIAKRVGIMTPENIHMNSFMFEPILDMAPQHLISLYESVKTLSDRWLSAEDT